MNSDQLLKTMHAGMTLSELVRMLRRRKWIVSGILAVAIAVAIVSTATSSRVYSAEAEVLIRTEESANLFPLSEVETLLRSPSAESGFLSSTEFEVAAQVAAGSEVAATIDVGDVTSRIEPSLIRFGAEASNPEQAAQIAQAWADTYITMRHDLDAAELLRTLSTLEVSVEGLSDQRASLLEALDPLDTLLSRTTDGGEVASLSTQRIVLLQQLEPSLNPIDQQLVLLNHEIANLRLVEDFFDSPDLSARTNRIARVPESPVSPSLPKNLLLAMFLGSLAALAAVFLMESLDEGFRNAEDVHDKTGLQPLAQVPVTGHGRPKNTMETGLFEEAFQRLASAIDFAGLEGGTKQVLVFTSARSGEGKTSTVSGLGRTLARQGRRTIVIGADLRRPTLAASLGEDRGPGLGEVLFGLYDYRTCLKQPSNTPGLDLLPAGSVPDGKNPAELLRSPAFEGLIRELRESYDHILIDSPPLLPVVDALNVAEVADGIVLQVFAGRSRVDATQQAVSLINRAVLSAPVIGFVLTGKQNRTDASYYDYGYTEETPAPRSLRRWKTKLVDNGTNSGGDEIDIVDLNQPLPDTEYEPVNRVGADLMRLHADRERATALSDTPWFSTVVELPQMSKPLDEIEFDPPSQNPMHDQQPNDPTAEPKTRKWWNMKLIRAALAAPFLLVLLLPGVASAQTYEGANLETGIFFVPDTPSGGEDVNFKATGFLPGSDVTFTFVDENGQDVDGLAVAGAVVYAADANGDIDIDLRLPDNLAAGTYSLLVQGSRSSSESFEAQWSFVVSAATAAANSASGSGGTGALALTGSDSRSAVAGGALLVLVGAGLIGIAATRRRESPIS